MLAKIHEESSLLFSMSEVMWIGMKEIIREKANEFIHEVGPIEHIFGVPRNCHGLKGEKETQWQPQVFHCFLGTKKSEQGRQESEREQFY